MNDARTLMLGEPFDECSSRHAGFIDTGNEQEDKQV
jgi:hypothetical protein